MLFPIKERITGFFVPFSRVVFLLLLVLTFGCINYDQEVELNKDGSGKMRLHYSISQQLSALMSMDTGSQDKKDEMPFKFKEEEIRASLQAEGVKVEKVETKVENDQHHVNVSLTFDHLTNLNRTDLFKGMQFEWNENEAEHTVLFRQMLVASGKDMGGPSEGAQFDEGMMSAMLGNAKFTFRAKLPSKALPPPNTNGTIQEDGTVVYWEYPLVKLGSGDKVLEAKFEKGGLLSGKVLFLGIGAFVSVVGLILIIILARK